jgi:predicted phage terminase large subunit-like protein
LPVPYHKSECRSLEKLRAIHSGSQSGLTFEQWLNLRDRCRKDLFFLTVSILGWTRVIERVHRPVCDFFGKLNFDGVYHDGYTLEELQNAIARQDPDFKEGLLLDPRGAFKSTINGCNCVRWLLNCPDIRIFIVTGEYDNAVLFLQQIKKYFYQPEGAPRTKLQQLFPEYIIGKRDGESESPLECPARIHTEQKEPSLWVNAVTATLASQHCDLKIGDDVVSDRNSTTPEARKKLKDKYDNVDNLLDEWGYAINIGTRYALDDYYGERLRIPQEDAPLKYFCRAAWTVKPEFANLPLRELKEHMVDLLFPEKLNWKVLRKKLLKNERDFRCQQMNEPQPDVDAVNFNEDVLRSHLEQHSAAPQDGDLVIAWDWAPTSTDKADYSAGAVGRIDKSKAELHILEIVFGRWKYSELAFQIVSLAKKHNPRIILVEKSAGTELLQGEIARVARRLQVPTPIIFRDFGNKDNAKANRIKGLETLLAEDRLFFVQGPWIDETFAQFVRYTGLKKNKGRKDDIPDAVSMLQFFLPAEPRTPVDAGEAKKAQEDAEKKAAGEAYMRMVFNRNPAAPPVMRTEPNPRRSRFDFRNFGLTQ